MPRRRSPSPRPKQTVKTRGRATPCATQRRTTGIMQPLIVLACARRLIHNFTAGPDSSMSPAFPAYHSLKDTRMTYKTETPPRGRAFTKLDRHEEKDFEHPHSGTVPRRTQ